MNTLAKIEAQHSPTRVFSYYASTISLVVLIALLILWEGKLAPLRPGGSMMVLKALPLLAAFFGILRGKIYTYQWASMLILAYFAEGVVRLWSDAGVSAWLAGAEIALSIVFFSGALIYIRECRRAAALPTGSSG